MSRMISCIQPRERVEVSRKELLEEAKKALTESPEEVKKKRDELLRHLKGVVESLRNINN